MSARETSFQAYRSKGAHEERILIVDDEPLIRAMLADYFKGMGYAVTTAESGEDALEKFSPGRFECTISDLAMPGIDGMELLKRIRAKDPTALFLIITGYPTIESAVETVKLGAYDYITKPLQLEDLLIKVERALYTRELESSIQTSNDRLRRLIIAVPIIIVLAILLGLVFKVF